MLATVTTIMCEGREEVAIVVRDHGDGTVNLMVIDSDGRTRPDFNVPISHLRATDVPTPPPPPAVALPLVVDPTIGVPVVKPSPPPAPAGHYKAPTRGRGGHGGAHDPGDRE